MQLMQSLAVMVSPRVTSSAPPLLIGGATESEEGGVRGRLQKVQLVHSPKGPLLPPAVCTEVLVWQTPLVPCPDPSSLFSSFCVFCC